MFKELVFELSGGEPRTWHSRWLFQHPSVTARMQILHATPDVAWELYEVSGDSETLAELRHLLEEGPREPMSGLEIVSANPRCIQYVVRWERPEPDVPYVSIEFLLYDLVGPEGIFHMRIENHRAEVKVAGPDGEKLLRFFNEAKSRLGGVFQLRLTRVGELRPGWQDAPHARGSLVREEDRQLVAFALASGYYDNPKKCGVRELGDALGCSKSVVARRLRSIERRALESLVRHTEVPVQAAASALAAAAREAAPPPAAFTALRAG